MYRTDGPELWRNWSPEVRQFVYSIYDVRNGPGSDEQRFSAFARSPALESLRRLVSSFEETLPINTVLYRARPGSIVAAGTTGVPHHPTDFGQHPDRPGGRSHFKGQHCLYCAERPETALAEVRRSPDLSAVSICEMRTRMALRMANLEAANRAQHDHSPATPVFTYFTLAMTTPEEKLIEELTPAEYAVIGKPDKYLVTQMIAELCRVQGFDGVVYTSVADGRGRNVAIFREEAVAPIRSWLVVDTDPQFTSTR